MTRALIATLWYFALSFAALAQVKPSHEITQFVANVSEAFLDQLVKEDFVAERAFMSDRPSIIATLVDWQSARQQVIEVAGKTPRHTAHGLTYYQDEHLLAAVDFSGRGENPDFLICGFMLWELPSPNAIGLVRFEENVVSVNALRRMPVQEAAQTMTNWRCPSEMIEDVLAISAK